MRVENEEKVPNLLWDRTFLQDVIYCLSWKVIKIPDKTFEKFSKRLSWYFKIYSGDVGLPTRWLTVLELAYIFNPLCD